MKNKIISSVSSQIIYILVSAMIGLALVPITINMLGKIEYGAFELILSLILIDTFLEFGLGSSLVKYIPEFKHDIEKLKVFTWSYYYIKLSLSLIGLLVVSLIGYYFDSVFNLTNITNIQDIKTATYIFGFGLIISGSATFLDNFLKGFVYFGLTNTTRIFSIILFFLVFYIYYKFNTYYSIVYIALIWFIIKPLILLTLNISLVCYLKLNYILKPISFNLESIHSTLKYMFGMTYIVMVAQLYNKLPKIIIGIFLNPTAVAYWGIMEKIKEPLGQLEGSMIRPLIPILSDKQNIVNMSEKKIYQAIRLQYFFMSFLAIITIVNIDLFIQLWLGNGYETVSNLVKIILLPLLFPKSGILLMMYYAKGKTKINSNFVTLNTLATIFIGTIVLTTTNDLEYFAWTSSIVLIIMTSLNIIKYIDYFKLLKVRFLKDTVISPLLVIFSYYFTSVYVLNFTNQTLNGLLINILISILVYIILFLIFMKQEDKKILINLMRKRK